MARRRVRKPPPKSWDKAAVTDEVWAAIKAIHDGVASADQQKAGLNWIIAGAGKFNDPCFEPGHPDVTAYLAGCRFVPWQIIRIMRMLRPPSEEEGEE